MATSIIGGASEVVKGFESAARTVRATARAAHQRLGPGLGQPLQRRLVPGSGQATVAARRLGQRGHAARRVHGRPHPCMAM